LATPDDSGQQRLHETINELDPASTLGGSDASVVALTKANAERFIGAIQQLGKSNLRLAHEFRNVKTFILIGLVALVLLLCGLIYALVGQAKMSDAQLANAAAQAETTRKLAVVIGKLETAIDDMADDVEEIPRIEVKPADTSDPTSKPVAVIEVPHPKKSQKEPRVKSVEIPLELTPRKKK